MVIRKEKDVEKLLKAVDKIWQLNLNEDELLETVFNLILAGKTKEIVDVLNFYTSEEWENLLKEIPKKEVEYYAQRFLNLLSEDDIEDCEKCKGLKDYSDDDIMDEFYGRELERFGNFREDIVTQMQIKELVSNFLSADFEKRKKMLEL